MAEQRNPDIQRLLANLRGGNPVHSSGSQVQGVDNSAHNASASQQGPYVSNAFIPGLGLLPSVNNVRQPVATSKPATPQPEPRQSLQPEFPRDRSATPVLPDSSTITTWPAALKYVTKHITSNEKAASKIKRLISEQHKHERQWWAGREAIVSRHSGRADNQAKVADLLKSLGGASIPVVVHDPKADKAELDAYDQKVYRSLTDMTADFDRQLRGLQVPFFAVKHDLVILDDAAQKESDTKGKLDKGELRELQRRMVREFVLQRHGMDK